MRASGARTHLACRLNDCRPLPERGRLSVPRSFLHGGKVWDSVPQPACNVRTARNRRSSGTARLCTASPSASTGGYWRRALAAGSRPLATGGGAPLDSWWLSAAWCRTGAQSVHRRAWLPAGACLDVSDGAVQQGFLLSTAQLRGGALACLH